MQLYVLVYPLKNGSVLLMRKKRGIGKGRINAPGGKVEAGESPEEAAARELREEVGVVVEPEDLEFAGLLEFFEEKYGRSLCYVFLARKFSGEPKATEEAEPFWCPIASIPFDEMWEDDRFWLPLVLKGRKVFGRFWFDTEDHLVKKEIFLLKSP